ncbi:NTP transferase domain-containing protein [Rhodobacteraceae bacterium 2CG4]|uniref:NTP transferase domain-containing protein n=2 Tax=Halovulum marinum TaxID=2662447 RepID=A0A6L5YYQ7_9RHOB|nr:NTP transferase domain-containing protein [Halovulum marinum]
MLFAAGRGTRMRHLTEGRPKPLVPVAGRPLIDHALDLLVAGGVRRVVVNTHYLGAQIAAHLAAERRLRIALSPEDGALLDTGGGLRHAAPLLGAGPVWTLNPDAIWRGPNPLRALPGGVPGGARLLLVPRGRALGHRGVGDFFLMPDGRLRRRGGADAAPYVYTGLQIIDPAPVAALDAQAFSLNLAWDAMLAEGRLFGAVYDGDWCDVGRPESIPLAEGLLADA